MAGVCDDLIVEIFTRLPPKSLLRFRSLSKSWYCRIRSPDFIRKHTLCSPQKFLIRHTLHNHEKLSDIKSLYTIHSEDGLLPRCPSTDVPIFKFPYPNSAEIIGSCNGILCIYEHENNTISLWNPSIRHKLTLPPPAPPSWKSCLFGHSVVVGFGFDRNSDDYKVIFINKFEFEELSKCSFVYAVKSTGAAWCDIAYPASPFYRFSSRACFVNGALHWLVDMYVTETKEIKRYIMTLDLSTCVFGTIALPEYCVFARELTIIKGSLAVISREADKSWICWARQQEDHANASWYVVYKTKTDPFGDVSKIFEMTTNGNFLLRTYWYTCHQVYNFETGVSSRLERLSAFCAHVDLEKCVETLELLDTGTAYDQNQPS